MDPRHSPVASLLSRPRMTRVGGFRQSPTSVTTPAFLTRVGGMGARGFGEATEARHSRPRSERRELRVSGIHAGTPTKVQRSRTAGQPHAGTDSHRRLVHLRPLHRLAPARPSGYPGVAKHSLIKERNSLLTLTGISSFIKERHSFKSANTHQTMMWEQPRRGHGKAAQQDAPEEDI